MNTLKCLIVDDEPLAINVIVNFLARLNIRDPVRCLNAPEAQRLLLQKDFDLLFLDIRMPKLSGLDLLKTISRRPLVVITTAYRDYAVEGFELEVQDYLVKPFSFLRFQQTMEKITRLTEPSGQETRETGQKPVAAKESLLLKVDRCWLKIPLADIFYIESLKDYVRVTTTTGEYICHQSLSDITDSLPRDRFARVHRSFTICLDKVEQVRLYNAYIRQKPIPISRAHRSEILRRLGQ